MQEDRAGVEDTFEHIDADAVCEQCSTVNPAGTLLCKNCGNNLRDQRMRRLAADEGMEVVHRAERPLRLLTGLLVVLGLLAILWTAINVWNGNIENWLTQQIAEDETSGGFDPRDFWTGADAHIYNELSRELRENPITSEEAARTGPGTAPQGSLTGRYVVLAGGAGSRMAGGAIARARGNTVLFVAQLGERVELRGSAEITADGQYEAEVVGVEWGSTTLDGYGVARRQADGGLSIVGRLSNAEDQIYSATAYKVAPQS